MTKMEKTRRMMEATRSRAPMMRVPVCREAHPQQFGRATIFANKYH